MVLLFRAWCAVSVVASVSAKKKKKAATRTAFKDKHDPSRQAEDANAAEENEYTRTCSECFKMAQHASRALKFNLEHGQEPTRDGWLGVLRAGCGYEESNLCNRVLLPAYGGRVADELAEIYEAADGDHRDSATDFPALSDALCGGDSITGACPPGFHAHPKPPKPEPGSWEARGEDFRDKVQLSFWNDCSLGAVELHLVDRNVVGRGDCVASETAGDPALVRVVRPGEDKLVTLFKTVPDRPENATGVVNTIDNTRTAVRVKPAAAPCGDGLDVMVDFDVLHAVYRIKTNPEFNGYQPRNETNVPLVATRMGASETVAAAASAASAGEL